MWDFEFNLRKTTASRRLNLTLEDKEKQIFWICDMACPQENNIVTKRDEKRTKHRQLAFKLREQRAEYKIYVIPVVTGALGGGSKDAICEVNKIFQQDDLSKNITGEMLRTILMNYEKIIRNILSGLIRTSYIQHHLIGERERDNILIY